MQFTKRTPKICQSCGKDFMAKKSTAEFCSQSCRPSTKILRLRPKSELSPNKCGAHSELITCAYLLRQGFDVYRAVNWTAKADLVAVRGNEIIRVQVKTGGRHYNGTLSYPKPPGDDHDLLIVVDHAGNIVVEEYRSGPKIAQAA
jgi:hypothetical protein